MLYKVEKPNSTLMSWKLKLEELTFDFKYKKGKENIDEDALSRVEINFNENLQKSLNDAPKVNLFLPQLEQIGKMLNIDQTTHSISNDSDK